MRVLFSTTAGAGHFGPLVPVAQACLAAGLGRGRGRARARSATPYAAPGLIIFRFPKRRMT